MAGINITSLAATATRLIRENGRDASLVTVTSTGPDWEPVLTETVTAIKLVQSSFNAMDKDLFTLQENDVKYLISSAYTPTKQAKIRDTLDYTIIDLKVIKPGETTALYIVQARV